MGREWYLNWGTKSSSKKGRTSGGGGGGGGSGGRNGNSSQGLDRKSTAPPAATAAAAVASTGGCMNAVLHLFDFQHFQLCLHPQDSSLLPDDPTPLKGVEAPRNSLESITGEEKDDHLLIVKKGIQIKTNRRDTGLKLVQVPRTKIEDLSSESSYSPAAGARTPNLVARLMGLEILPESNTTTPRSSSHSQISPHIRASTPPITTKTSKTTTPRSTRTTSYHTDVPGGLRSSPETPRSSTSTRRRSTDVVVDHHRLSLQINKENSIVKEMELARPSCSAIHTKRKDGRNYDEEVTKSPSYYARQIMKQVKETVSRRVGVDITNTINNNNNGGKDHQRRDEHLLSSSSSTTTTTTTTKPKKSKKDQTHNLSLSSKSDHQLVARVLSDIVDSKTIIEQKEVTRSENESLSKKFATNSSSKKPHKSFYNSIRNKKEEQFVRPLMTTNKKCKKNMLSSDLLHGTVPSSLVPLKKDFSSVTPAKLLHKQGISSNVQPFKPINKSTTTTTTTTRLSRYPRQRVDEKKQEEAMHAPAADNWRSKKDASGTSIMEFQYITRILKCTGIDRDTPISFMRWYLPSHPLDPSIFHSLEATHYLTTTDDNSCQQLNLAINRKLLFHLVDEMLADMLKPCVKLKHHHHHHHHYHHDYKQDYRQINGFQLVKILCTKIRSFPSADCETLQDIDALVEKDLPRFGVESNMIAYQEDGGEIVSEIERVIMDSLVQEIFCLN